MSNTITVYQADVNGIFLHADDANEDPNQPGRFSVPFGAYIDAPATIPAGQVAQRQGSAWVNVADNRKVPLYRTDTGEAYSLGSVMLINDAPFVYIGVGPVPTQLTTDAPPAPGSTWTNGAWVAPAPSTSGTSSSGS